MAYLFFSESLNKNFLFLFIGFITTLSSLFPATVIRAENSHGQEKPVRIAILPCADVVKTFISFASLARHIEKETGRRVSIIVPKSSDAFVSLIEQGECEFAYQAAHVYVRLADSYNQDSLLSALTPSGERQHYGVLIVRKDSGIQKISDLKGKSILFGTKTSTVKSIAAQMLLESHGLKVDEDLADYSHDNSCEASALNVYLKVFDAAFMCDYSYHSLMKPGEKEYPIPQGSLAVIGKTMKVPTWIFAAMRQTDKSLVTAVKRALLGLTVTRGQDREIMETAEIGGFVTAQDCDYQSDDKKSLFTTVGP